VEGWLGKGMRVTTRKSGLGCLPTPPGTDGGAGRDDVRFVERRAQGRSAMARGPERHALFRLVRVGLLVVVGVQQGRQVDETARVGWLTGSLARHLGPSSFLISARAPAARPVCPAVGVAASRRSCATVAFPK
jgi:hypothetical protein